MTAIDVRPYDPAALLPYEHVMAYCPAVPVDPQALEPTQLLAVVGRLRAIANGGPAEGPDPYPHVVEHAGRLYVHNGHHRWLVALCQGRPSILVRIQKAPNG